MAISDVIAPHLPFLRRFSRALTGNQTSGDACAAASLEAIIADPSSFDQSVSPRVALYKTLLHVWSSLPINADASRDAIDANDPDSAGMLKVAALTPRSRVAFLLSAVEGFKLEEIGSTLACHPIEA